MFLEAKKNLEAHITDDSTIIVAVSGGSDSVALLDIVSRVAVAHGWKVSVAHVDHGIRGAKSTEDAEFVRKIALARKTPFYMKKVYF